MNSPLYNLKERIKLKEELSGISDSILEKSIEEYIKKNKIDLSKEMSEKDFKLIVKDLRDKLRLIHGRFQINPKKREKHLESNENEEILKSHLSTNERLKIYPEVTSLISNLNPKSILDIACGLNPIALASPDKIYYAIDINEEEISLIERFFKKNKIFGAAICSDINDIDFEKLPNFDICLIFKFLDFVKNGNKVSEYLLKNVKSKIFLTSFATKSISGKKNRQKRRIWYERILNKLNHSFEIFEFENEIFYLSKKQQKEPLPL